MKRKMYRREVMGESAILGWNAAVGNASISEKMLAHDLGWVMREYPKHYTEAETVYRENFTRSRQAVESDIGKGRVYSF